MSDGYDEFWDVCNLTPSEWMERCPDVAALVDAARRVHANLEEGDFISATRLDELQAALAVFTQEPKT